MSRYDAQEQIITGKERGALYCAKTSDLRIRQVGCELGVLFYISNYDGLSQTKCPATAEPSSFFTRLNVLRNGSVSPRCATMTSSSPIGSCTLPYSAPRKAIMSSRMVWIATSNAFVARNRLLSEVTSCHTNIPISAVVAMEWIHQPGTAIKEATEMVRPVASKEPPPAAGGRWELTAADLTKSWAVGSCRTLS